MSNHVEHSLEFKVLLPFGSADCESTPCHSWIAAVLDRHACLFGTPGFSMALRKALLYYRESGIVSNATEHRTFQKTQHGVCLPMPCPGRYGVPCMMLRILDLRQPSFWVKTKTQTRKRWSRCKWESSKEIEGWQGWKGKIQGSGRNGEKQSSSTRLDLTRGGRINFFLLKMLLPLLLHSITQVLLHATSGMNVASVTKNVTAKIHIRSSIQVATSRLTILGLGPWKPSCPDN